MHDKLGKSKVLCIYTSFFKYSRVYTLVHLAEVAYKNMFGKLNYWSDNTDSPPFSVLFPTVQEKKQKEEIRICVNLRKLNDACLHDPFPTLFTDEVLDNVGNQEAYSFTDGFSGYHQIKIAPEDRSKMTFVAEWGWF